MTKQSKIKAPKTHEIQSVNINRLYLSDLNPRQEVDEDEIVQLSQSIEACGLIHNLSGLKDAKGDKIGVVAGGRRYRALLLALKNNPALVNVDVRVTTDPTIAEQWANVENSQRKDLHPAQEIRAFGKMAETNSDVPTIAKVFGVTEPLVYRYLKLAQLPEAVLDALQAGEINMSMVQAFTVSEDAERSLAVLDEVRNSNTTAHHVKRLLKPDAINATDRRAIFVGETDYKAAGGAMGGDLFADKQTFDSPDILDEAFNAKLDTTAAEIKDRDGWAWVTPIEQQYYDTYHAEQEGFKIIDRICGSLNKKQRNRFKKLKELNLYGEISDAEEVEYTSLLNILDGEFSAEQKQIAGAVLFVNSSGEAKVREGLVRKADIPEAIEAGLIEKPAPKNGEDKPKSPYSAKLTDDLKAVKTASVQNAALDHSNLLLDLLAFQLSGEAGYCSPFAIDLKTVRSKPSTETGLEVDERLTAENNYPENMWDVDLVQAFEAFQAKGQKHRNAELTRQLSKVMEIMNADFAPIIAERVGADIRKVWTPTAENFFKRVSATYLDTLFQDMLDLKPTSESAKGFASLKKGVKAELMENIFSCPDAQKTYKVTPDQLAKMQSWVPDCIA